MRNKIEEMILKLSESALGFIIMLLIFYIVINIMFIAFII